MVESHPIGLLKVRHWDDHARKGGARGVPGLHPSVVLLWEGGYQQKMLAGCSRNLSADDD